MTKTMDRSEFSTRPGRILLHHPSDGASLHGVTSDHLSALNFFEVPKSEALYAQYDRLVDAIAGHTEPVFLRDILRGDAGYEAEARSNPNLIFTRDSSVTLPWAPGHFIATRPFLKSRVNEPAIVRRALDRLGLTNLVELEGDEYLEGGDVLPIMDDGKRILLVGFGARTTKGAAIKLALELIPHHLDQIIGLSHDHELLHLDTGFTVLPNRTIFAAAGMFTTGFLIDESRSLKPVNPIRYAEEMGFTIIRCAKPEAIAHERCNMLPLGSGQYVAFDMPADMRHALEQAACITVTCLDGSEIAKAAGGVHCLTRPLYSES
jgi:N-dimethylarginine dimethylaminohydrolase